MLQCSRKEIETLLKSELSDKSVHLLLNPASLFVFISEILNFRFQITGGVAASPPWSWFAASSSRRFANFLKIPVTLQKVQGIRYINPICQHIVSMFGQTSVVSVLDNWDNIVFTWKWIHWNPELRILVGLPSDVVVERKYSDFTFGGIRDCFIPAVFINVCC